MTLGFSLKDADLNNVDSLFEAFPDANILAEALGGFPSDLVGETVGVELCDDEGGDFHLLGSEDDK